jgi:hypothetical protein
MIDKQEQIRKLEANIAKWQVIADRHPDPDRASGIRRGIQADLGHIEYLTDTAEAEPTVADEAQELAAQEKRRILVQAEAKKILETDPEVPEFESSGEKQAELNVKSVTPRRG